MRINKKQIDELTEDIVNKAISLNMGVRCNKEDFDKIINFIDTHNMYQFIVESSHKYEYDYYVRFGTISHSNLDD